MTETEISELRTLQLELDEAVAAVPPRLSLWQPAEQERKGPEAVEVGEQYVGVVVKNAAFGAFVSVVPGRDGLLHISEVRKLVGGMEIGSVDDVLSVGEPILVRIEKFDERGHISLETVL